MARQRVLTNPVKADIDGNKSEYNLVRITRLNLEISQKFDDQYMIVDWTVGRLITFKNSADEDVTLFERAPFDGMSGSKSYNNAPPYLFGQFLQKVLPLGIGPFLDQIFQDLEDEGLIKPGIQQDYGLAPGS